MAVVQIDSDTTVTTKLQLIGKGVNSGSRTYTIPNCIPKEDFNTQDVPVFWNAINIAYGADYQPVVAKYVVSSETVVARRS